MSIISKFIKFRAKLVLSVNVRNFCMINDNSHGKEYFSFETKNFSRT